MIGTDLDQAKHYLDNDYNIGFPTETVYGLAANAFSVKAISSVFEVKNRPKFDPLIVHIGDIARLDSLVLGFDNRLKQLAELLWPGPLTLLLPKSNLIPDLVTNGSELAAFRIPNHPLGIRLLKMLDYPLVAPSANPFKYISPTTAQHVQDQLGDKIPYILDGGDCQIGLESTIVGIENDKPTIFRKGGIPIERIQSIIGDVFIKATSDSNPLAPGMLSKHYSPTMKLKCGDIAKMINEHKNEQVAILSFSADYGSFSNVKKQIVLSPSADLNEAAQNLFRSLRSLDNTSGIDCILTEFVPDHGIGRAINDRLKRAAYSD